MELHKNDIFAGRYRLEEKLGAGGFGEVWKAFDNVTHKYFAIKIHLNGDSEKAAQEIVKEYTRVMHIHHDNLLTPSHVDITDGVVPYLVMELCTTDLSDKDLDEMQVWHLIRDTAAGLRRLAENKRSKERLDGTASEVADPIIHQDIKPANILIRANGMYAISDFGISKRRLSSTRATTDIVEPEVDSAMTTDYAAPERFPRGKGVAVLASDIWSLGATLFEVVEGHRPFAECGGDCLNPTIGLKIPAIKREGYSLELKQLIYDCMSMEPSHRPHADQLYRYAENALKGEQRKVEWTGAPSRTKEDGAKRPTAFKGSVKGEAELPPPTPGPTFKERVATLYQRNRKVLTWTLYVVAAIILTCLFMRYVQMDLEVDGLPSYEGTSDVDDELMRTLRKSTGEDEPLFTLRYVWENDTLTGRRNTVEITDTIKALASRWMLYAKKSNRKLLNYSFEEDYSIPQNLEYLEELTRHFVDVCKMEEKILLFWSEDDSYRGCKYSEGESCVYPVQIYVTTMQDDFRVCRDSLEATLAMADNVFCRGMRKLEDGKRYTTREYKPYFDSAIAIVNHYFHNRQTMTGDLDAFVNKTKYQRFLEGETKELTQIP